MTPAGWTIVGILVVFYAIAGIYVFGPRKRDDDQDGVL